MDVKYRCFNSKRRFGIELEVEKTLEQSQIRNLIRPHTKKQIETTGWAQSNSNNYWHVKYDSTCGPKGKGKDKGGWEIASFVASGYKDLLEIEKITDALKEGGCQVNKNCGVHIHAEVADFNIDQIGVLCALWYKIEPWVCNAVPSSRINNKYCKLICKTKAKKIDISKKYAPKTLWGIIKPTNLGVHDNSEKKVTLNTVGVATKFHYASNGYDPIPSGVRQTIELRMPEGTLSGKEVKNWVRFFVNFVDHARKAEMPDDLSPAKDTDELMQYLGLSSPNHFTILSKGLHETKSWLLKRIRKHGSTYGKRAEAVEKLNFMRQPVESFSL